MSNQRRVRAELRQGLTQFLMSLYRSYSTSMGHKDAVALIKDVIKEEYEYFVKETMTEDTNDHLSSTIESLANRAKTEKNAERQYEIYEDLEVLLSAKEIFKKYANGEI